jgi:hypothetical protein
MPLLYLVSVSLPYQKINPFQVAAGLCLVTLVVLALHWFIEMRRRAWQSGTQRALNSPPVLFRLFSVK